MFFKVNNFWKKWTFNENFCYQYLNKNTVLKKKTCCIENIDLLNMILMQLL